MGLSEIFRQRRHESGLSQAKLAGLTGAKPQTISYIEIGRRVPENGTIWRLGAALCFHRTEIVRFIGLATHYRKNRDKLQEEYAIKFAEKILGRHRFSSGKREGSRV